MLLLLMVLEALWAGERGGDTEAGAAAPRAHGKGQGRGVKEQRLDTISLSPDRTH